MLIDSWKKLKRLHKLHGALRKAEQPQERKSMPDPKIHSLNVKDGDCFLLERPSGRVTMIDICCGNYKIERVAKSLIEEARAQKPRGNYNMCSTPTNPVEYLSQKGISNIWRFILT